VPLCAPTIESGGLNPRVGGSIRPWPPFRSEADGSCSRSSTREPLDSLRVDGLDFMLAEAGLQVHLDQCAVTASRGLADVDFAFQEVSAKLEH
jgi:hypothetical protein